MTTMMSEFAYAWLRMKQTRGGSPHHLERLLALGIRAGLDGPQETLVHDALNVGIGKIQDVIQTLVPCVERAEPRRVRPEPQGEREEEAGGTIVERLGQKHRIPQMPHVCNHHPK